MGEAGISAYPFRGWTGRDSVISRSRQEDSEFGGEEKGEFLEEKSKRREEKEGIEHGNFDTQIIANTSAPSQISPFSSLCKQ